MDMDKSIYDSLHDSNSVFVQVEGEPKRFKCKKCKQVQSDIYRSGYWNGKTEDICFDCGWKGRDKNI